MTRIESRGVRCLECLHVDLQGDKEAAKRGFGKCLAASPPPYVSVIAAKTRSKRFHDAVTVACDALMKASQRPTAMLDLTTGEYQKIRAAIAAYLTALPALDVGLLNDACKIAERFLDGVPVVSH